MKSKFFVLVAIALSLIPLSGCKPNSESLQSSLIAAVRVDNTELAKKLIQMGVDVNSRTTRNGWSALHYAVRNGNAEVVQLLLKAGADPNSFGAIEGKTGSSVALKPLEIAKAALDLVSQVPPSRMEATLRRVGLDEPALLRSMTDTKAADRYRKVVEVLSQVTKS